MAVPMLRFPNNLAGLRDRASPPGIVQGYSVTGVAAVVALVLVLEGGPQKRVSRAGTSRGKSSAALRSNRPRKAWASTIPAIPNLCQETTAGKDDEPTSAVPRLCRAVRAAIGPRRARGVLRMGFTDVAERQHLNRKRAPHAPQRRLPADTPGSAEKPRRTRGGRGSSAGGSTSSRAGHGKGRALRQAATPVWNRRFGQEPPLRTHTPPKAPARHPAGHCSSASHSCPFSKPTRYSAGSSARPWYFDSGLFSE